MKLQWSLILGLFFALVTAVFAVMNVDPVLVNFGFDVVSIPLILIILGCALIGGVVVGSYGIFRQYKLQKQIKGLNAELSKLRDTGSSLDSISAPDDTFSSEGSSQL
ncbi:lipopolysaccharide assembly protein LapA domain-containing protein [Paenibacillus sp. MMS20-IR301]|uniref:LapA family protein n=1 Tax=Paenibacillus sp. MMS20-IR301 TaxID=2895946 RepID=UPI0028EBF5B6|nr:lipopolysaccharide assembly protein LapA domain-containing protein [Paenibacillus sp. MMS20-IR301]WNS46173.1 lipopolysaccharide assembly protein LapA domain-containing protein [Paenibacillus sp. MMS20-IR301]